MSPLPTGRLARARRTDRLAAACITGGGALILVSVGFLLVFLLVECLPLLGRGHATPENRVGASTAPLVAIEDEYRETVAVLGRDGVLHVVRRDGRSEMRPLEGVVAPVAEATVDASGRLLALRDGQGRVQVWSVRMRPSWRGQERGLELSVAPVLVAPPLEAGPILAVAGTGGSAGVLLATPAGGLFLRSGADGRAIPLGAGSAAVAGALTSSLGEAWLASEGELLLFELGGGEDSTAAQLVARAPLPQGATALAMALGDVTCLAGDATGTVTGWQAVEGPMAGSRILDRSATFPGHGAVRRLVPSQRDKTFLALRPERAELYHLTTRRQLLALPEFPSGVVWASLSPRRDGAAAVTANAQVHRWSLDIPHPEVSFSTLFLPVRYEGFTTAELVWQSTGGTSSFEPKLSLVPLIVGTCKGALYALLFSAPTALGAALYVSQFAPRRLRLVTKPVVELMAALPSVVVGFLAALVFAPWLQRHIVAVLATLLAIPVAVVAAAALWSATPRTVRRRLTAGGELALVGGAAAAAVTLTFALEGSVTRLCFGGDFQAWLANAVGVTYDQRNAVVVGFALGVAVIPVIFTLAEDAFSNVPPSLISAALALGATRWQAARTVAIPAASPGLFAAVMTGLGRAVGETMIVLMATGNTPLLSLSPFNGMRTMSACIAVELPEAPYGGTLYRVLILTALLLFVMTFAINTVAVMVSNRLRRRFGRLAA